MNESIELTDFIMIGCIVDAMGQPAFAFRAQELSLETGQPLLDDDVIKAVEGLQTNIGQP